jgi:plastocyanin
VSAVAGCSGTDDVELVRGVTVGIDARDNTFDPETVEVAAGTNVRFVNVGRNDHNVIPVSGDQEELYVPSDELTPDAEAVVRLTEPGTYRYYCSIHGTPRAGMIGEIEVTE